MKVLEKSRVRFKSLNNEIFAILCKLVLFSYTRMSGTLLAVCLTIIQLIHLFGLLFGKLCIYI